MHAPVAKAPLQRTQLSRAETTRVALVEHRHQRGAVEHSTLARTPKASARWYRDVIARGGLP